MEPIPNHAISGDITLLEVLQENPVAQPPTDENAIIVDGSNVRRVTIQPDSADNTRHCCTRCLFWGRTQCECRRPKQTNSLSSTPEYDYAPYEVPTCDPIVTDDDTNDDEQFLDTSQEQQRDPIPRRLDTPPLSPESTTQSGNFDFPEMEWDTLGRGCCSSPVSTDWDFALHSDESDDDDALN